MQYRKEIDGLRAIAVLPVILFHGDIGSFNGGYIGVDVFFVISGFLITSIILEDIKNNTFSVLGFYERRARRILPALSIVLLFTTFAAYLLMPAPLLKLYSQSVVSVSVFASNVFFYLTSGYFSTAADEKPLLHTWSLAVEEQYYIFFPVMLTLLWSLGKKWVISVLSLLIVISLLFAQYLSLTHAVDANFYLIFSRAWELLLGSAVAFMALDKLSCTQWQRELSGFIGISMIVYAIFFFDAQTPFPSVYTLIPVLGTCLIIIFSDANSLVGRFLGMKVLVFIGLISYSLYLWHQPLFAFLRLKTIGTPADYMFLLAIVCTFVFSFFSWKYIEKPFRNKAAFSRAAIFKYSATSIAVFFVIGLAGHFYEGFEQRFKVSSYADSIQRSPKREACHTEGLDYLPPASACRYFGNNISWAIFGDSHTVEPGYALAQKLQPHDIGLLHLSFSDCPPALNFEVSEPGCSRWTNESLAYLEHNPSIKHVLIAYRYSYYLFGNHINDYPELPDIDPSRHFTSEFRNSAAGDSREIYWQSLQQIIVRLMRAGKTVYVMYPVPELPININKGVMPFSVFAMATVLDLEKATSARYYFDRHAYIINKLDSLPYGKNLYAIKPFDIICDGNACPAAKEGKAFYFDDDHLSLVGSALIAETIMNTAAGSLDLHQVTGATD